MKANEFVKIFGMDKAKKVVEKAPTNAESFWGPYYFRESPQFQFHNGFHEWWNLTTNDGAYFKKNGFDPVAIDDLKRLVESHELIESCGGLQSVGEKLTHGMYESRAVIERLEQAILDVESCQ